MSLVYDLQGTQSRDHGERGIARYILELALALERRHAGLVSMFTVNPNLPVPSTLEPILATGRVRRVDDPALRWATVFHLGSPFESGIPAGELLPVAVRRNGAAIVTTAYDVIPLLFADHYLAHAAGRSEYRRGLALLKTANEVLAISEATARDAVRVLGLATEHVHVIGAGASAFFCPPARSRADIAEELRLAYPALRPGYVLMPTGIDFRKNVDQSIAAYARLEPELRAAHQLVITCRIDENTVARVRSVTDELGVTDSVVLTGFVHDDHLVQLYQAADLVIFPSRYEGFGLPPLEARRCGAPVICGNNSSLVEVITNPEARFDADDVDSIAAVLRRAIVDEVFRSGLASEPLPPFTWDRCADLAANVYRSLLDRARRSRPRRRRLGVATILPPTSSGVADHSYHLCEALSRSVDVTVFLAEDPAKAARPHGVDVVPLAHLPHHVDSGLVDAVVYCLGNNALHSPHIEMLEHVRGAIFLHDVRLLNATAGTLDDSESLSERLERDYPFRYGSTPGALVPSLDHATVERKGILFARRAAQAASTVLVNSDFAATLVRLDAGVDAVNVGPLSCTVPAVSHAARPTGDGPVVGSFGIASPIKQTEKLVAALGPLLALVPDVRMVIAGPIYDELADRCLAIAEAQGVADRLVLTGELDAAEFARVQAGTTVAVQLRNSSNGESSAAVNDCLAHGVPTVVTAIGSAREYPSDSVVMVEREVTATELACVLADLLHDGRRLDDLRQAGFDYARRNTYDVAASRMLGAIFPE